MISHQGNVYNLKKSLKRIIQRWDGRNEHWQKLSRRRLRKEINPRERYCDMATIEAKYKIWVKICDSKKTSLYSELRKYAHKTTVTITGNNTKKQEGQNTTTTCSEGWKFEKERLQNYRIVISIAGLKWWNNDNNCRVEMMLNSQNIPKR